MLSQACIKEKLEDCELKVAVNFTQSDSCNHQPVYTKSDHITIFTFNQLGILIGRYAKDSIPFGSGKQITLNLKRGLYTLIAVAGLTDDDFADQRLINGQTRLSEFHIPSYRVKQGHKEAGNEALFVGLLRQIEITQNRECLIAMRLMRKPLKLTLNGALPEHSYQAVLSYNAVDYKPSTDLIPVFDQYHFTMKNLYSDAVEQNVYHAETGILWPPGNQASSLMIQDLTDGAGIFNADIKGLLAKLSHVDFNCEPIIDIQINYSRPQDIEIFINGWKVQYSEIEL